MVPAIVLLAIAAVPVSAQDDTETWLHDVATQYRAWGRVDDELRWAPWLCRMPLPSRARVSRASGDAHGQKVYFVYASDRMGYLGAVGGQRPPRGLTVVKEAFHPRVLPAEAPRQPVFGNPGAHPIPGREPGALMLDVPEIYRPLVAEDGAHVGAGDPGGLYVLRYVGRHVRNTDEGWLYGTMTPDGEVTSLGRVERCMSCHRDAPHGRLFGINGPDGAFPVEHP